MLVLTIRTDKPESEIALYKDGRLVRQEVWQAHRQLAETIHDVIAKVLQLEGKELADIEGVVVYKGPGSFTGLRIGISMANALAYGLGVSVVGTSGADWQQEGIKALASSQTDQYALPEYGAPVHITKAKK